jgi:hypothetical protein
MNRNRKRWVKRVAGVSAAAALVVTPVAPNVLGEAGLQNMLGATVAHAAVENIAPTDASAEVGVFYNSEYSFTRYVLRNEVQTVSSDEYDQLTYIVQLPDELSYILEDPFFQDNLVNGVNQGEFALTGTTVDENGEKGTVHREEHAPADFITVNPATNSIEFDFTAFFEENDLVRVENSSFSVPLYLKGENPIPNGEYTFQTALVATDSIDLDQVGNADQIELIVEDSDADPIEEPGDPTDPEEPEEPEQPGDGDEDDSDDGSGEDEEDENDSDEDAEDDSDDGSGENEEDESDDDSDEDSEDDSDDGSDEGQEDEVNDDSGENEDDGNGESDEAEEPGDDQLGDDDENDEDQNGEGRVVEDEPIEYSLDEVDSIDLQPELLQLIQDGQVVILTKDGIELELSGDLFDNVEDPVTVSIVEQQPAEDSLSGTYDIEVTQNDEVLSDFGEETVTLTFDVDQERVENTDNLNVFYYNEDTEEWERIGGEYSNGTVSAETNHLSVFTVFEVAVEDEESTVEITESGDSSGDDETKDEETLTVTSTSDEEGERLPDTATNTWAYGLAGALAVVLGGVVKFVSRIRRTN